MDQDGPRSREYGVLRIVIISSRGITLLLSIIHHPSSTVLYIMTFGDAQKNKSVAKLWLVEKEDELIGYHFTLARKLSSLENKGRS